MDSVVGSYLFVQIEYVLSRLLHLLPYDNKIKVDSVVGAYIAIAHAVIDFKFVSILIIKNCILFVIRDLFVNTLFVMYSTTHYYSTLN
jgi:hypothetical protein